MRSLVALVLLVPACVSEISGTGTDDGTRSGSDVGSGSADLPPQPRVTATFDRAVTTELAKTEMVTLTLKSEDGFAGNVTLGAVLTDSAGAAVNDVELTGPMTTSVTLAADATQTATFQVKVPMNALGSKLPGTLKVDLMSSLGTTTVTTPVTIDAVYTVDYHAGTGYTANLHTNAGNAPELTVKRGAILRFTNHDVIEHVIYAAGAFSNYHENTVSGGAPNRTYEIPTANLPAGSTGNLGCFNHGTGTYSTYKVE